MGALRGHLGRDERGHELLADVERVANTQRKDLAAEKERSTRLEQIAKDLRQQLEAAQAAIADAVRRTEVVDAQRKQAERERVEMADSLRAAQEEIAKLQPEDLEPFQLPKRRARLRKHLGVPDEVPYGGMFTPKPLTDLFNCLRREMRVCPAPLSARQLEESCAVYALDSIIENFSGAELLKLGRFVAILTLFGTSFQIHSDYVVLQDMDNEESLAPFFYWIRRSLSRDRNEKFFGPPTAKSGSINTAHGYAG